MRKLLTVVLVLSLYGNAQTSLVRISSEDAAKHIIQQPPPKYPGLAQSAHIMGNVIVELRINEDGSTSARRVVTGHPMLAPAALENVAQWKYQPFLLNGVPTSVATFAIVRFGDPKNHDASDKAELAFQDQYWSAINRERLAQDKSDFPAAEQELKRASDLLGMKSDSSHQQEHWQWNMTAANLAKAQKRYDDAERYYANAIAVYRDNRDSIEVANALAALGMIFKEQNKPGVAMEKFQASVAINRKLLKNTGQQNPSARQIFGRAIAYQSWELSQLALQQGDKSRAAAQCSAVLEFKEYLLQGDSEALIAECQKLNSGN